MCGINGFNFIDKGRLLAMNKKTHHRGPDDEGSFFSREWSFGHNRLSIIDLSPLGHQPMLSHDGEWAIIFNGEIYNYRELRSDLEKKGYKFRSKSDTEVLLCAFIEWGEQCLPKLNGIFAFAIINTKTEEVLLARDHMGVKPLYYYYKDNQFIFSSEAKALFAHNIDTTLDIDALNIYFRFLYIPSPLTIWKEVKKVPPAHFVKVRKGGIEIKRYWEIPTNPLIQDRSYCEQQIRHLLTDAVQRQLVADRPVGIFLSGGIDSTIITGIASKISPHINTFSVGFEDTEEADKYNNDARIARKTAAHFGTTHHEFIFSAEDIKTHLPETIYHMDEPISNHVQTVNMLLARKTAQHATVVLGGDGGDELFGGYERYYYSSLIDSLRRIPAPLRSLFLRMAKKQDLGEKINTPPGVERYLLFFAQKESLIASFLSPQINNSQVAPAWFGQYFTHSNFDFTRQFMRTDIQTWLPDESLMRSDKMTMSAGLEERIPFLDYRLVELADRIPVAYKLGKKGVNVFRKGHAYSGKMILKSAMKEYIPEFVLNQPKWGWFSPAAKWIRGPLHETMQETLSSSYCAGTEAMFDFDTLQQMLRDHNEKKGYHLNTLWAVMTFQMWYRQFMNK